MGFILNIIVHWLDKLGGGLAYLGKYLKLVLGAMQEFMGTYGIVGLICATVWPFVESKFDAFATYLVAPVLTLSELVSHDTTNFILYLSWQFQLPLLFAVTGTLLLELLALRLLYFGALIIKVATRLIP